ncbi:MAG TPA: hypothetical protein HPQ03_17205 [Deltaproteobacteria bacterium]|nr:hypothetical protein [Deltaproteobacteria bacterium]
MTDEIKELQETFQDKMKVLERFTYYRAGKNDDLRQEALLATWTGLQKDKNATDSYLRTRIRWQIRGVHRHSFGIDTAYRKRDDIEFIRSNTSDIDDDLCLAYVVNIHQQLDEQVIAKMDTEKFLNSLDYNEHQIVQYKLEGMRDRDIIHELHMSYKRYYDIKRGLRPKIAEHFSA